MPTPRPLHHVGVVVPGFDAVTRVLGEELELELSAPEAHPRLGIEVLWARAGAVPIELIRPLAPDSGAAAVLRGGGGGVHHIAFAVDDLDMALAHARRAGVGLRDERPRRGVHGSRIAFIDPASAGGVLIELVQPRASPAP